MKRKEDRKIEVYQVRKKERKEGRKKLKNVGNEFSMGSNQDSGYEW
jgi:hypothetical protein